MRFDGSASIGAAPGRVWAFLIDPRKVGKCVPGIGGIEIVDPEHFRITKVGVGTVRANLTVNVEQCDARAPAHVRFKADGRARGMSVQAMAEVDLGDGDAAGCTALAWSVDVGVTGPFAMVGTRMIDRTARSLIDQALRCMDSRLSGGSTARPSGLPLSGAEVRRFDPNWCLFWGHRVTGWQLDIWIPYIKQSRNRFAIMTPDDIGDAEREKVAAIPNAIIVEPYIQGLEWLRTCPGFRGYLYIGTRPENFQTINRHRNRAHVFIGHGESGKGTSGFRTGSLYDSIFVAEYSVVRRFPRAIRPWVWKGAIATGTTIVDGVRRDAWEHPRPVRTILYAPTWEGHVGDDFTSLDVVGPVLRELLPEFAAHGVEVLLRPHPGTGGRLPELKGILDDLRAAGVVSGLSKVEAFERADVLISDVSGVTAEFLLTEKPSIMPVVPKLAALGRDAAWLDVEYPWVYRWDGSATGLREILNVIELRDPLRARRATEARRKFRRNRSIDDGARAFDLALDTLRWRILPIPLRLPYELKRLRSRMHGHFFLGLAATLATVPDPTLCVC